MADKDLTWKEAIRSVLVSENRPTAAKRILELIRSMGLREITGKTPIDTVGAILATTPDLFVRTAPGIFRMRDTALDGVYVEPPVEPDESEESFESGDENLITYYGLCWERKDSNARRRVLQGMMDGEPINLTGTKGVYFLFSNETLVYIGRITDRTLAKRLDEHTKDNIGHRWNRFSFFLFNETVLDPARVTIGIEALLLELLNPTSNRAPGHLKGGVEVLPI